MAAGALLHEPDMKNGTRITEWSRLLGETPQYWLENMGREKTLAAALQLQYDGSRLQTNIQDMKLFLASLHEAASEVLRESIADQTSPVACYEYSDMINSFMNIQTLVPACGGWIIPRVHGGGQLHTALGLWRLPSDAGVSCMKGEYCFGRRDLSTQ